MIPDLIPVFLNGESYQVPPGTTLAGLVATADPELANALQAGQARATDGRGVAAGADAGLSAGAIFRVFRSARAGGAADV